METLINQFNVEINVLNVNRREERVFKGFKVAFGGEFVYCVASYKKYILNNLCLPLILVEIIVLPVVISAMLIKSNWGEYPKSITG